MADAWLIVSRLALYVSMMLVFGIPWYLALNEHAPLVALLLFPSGLGGLRGQTGGQR